MAFLDNNGLATLITQIKSWVNTKLTTKVDKETNKRLITNDEATSIANNTTHTSNKENPHGVTLNQLGITEATAAELNHLHGVTSPIQTQLDALSGSRSELVFADGERSYGVSSLLMTNGSYLNSFGPSSANEDDFDILLNWDLITLGAYGLEPTKIEASSESPVNLDDYFVSDFAFSKQMLYSYYADINSLSYISNLPPVLAAEDWYFVGEDSSFDMFVCCLSDDTQLQIVRCGSSSQIWKRIGFPITLVSSDGTTDTKYSWGPWEKNMTNILTEGYDYGTALPTTNLVPGRVFYLISGDSEILNSDSSADGGDGSATEGTGEDTGGTGGGEA